MDLIQKIKELKSGTLEPDDIVRRTIEKIKKEDKKINSFLQINEDAVKEARNLKKGPLYGLTIAVKSNINVKGLKASCASKTLENYTSTYDADVIKKIKDAGGIIIGMTNMDEFASGSSGESSAFGPTLNPIVNKKIPGGSSSGSAAAVAANFCDLALGSDTGGSIRNPASHCGIVGIKPTYGLVSRYGLIDLSMSLDQIGPLSKNVYGSALLLQTIQGKSKNDATTLESKAEYIKNLTDHNGITLGISEDLLKLCKDKKILKIFNENREKLESSGYKIKNVSLKHIDLAIQTYYLLVYVEFFSGTRKFDGRKYGLKIEDSCGEEVLRRIFGGKIITQAEYKGDYYKKGLIVKKLIKKDFMDAFKEVDAIISPVTPKLPHNIGSGISVEEMYAYDAFTTPANLAGICGGTTNGGFIDKTPVGIQVLCPHLKEETMFKVLNSIENGN